MDKEMQYGERLAALLREKTVSTYDESGARGFPRFRELLKEMFPRVFSVCHTEEYNGCLLLRWAGRDPHRCPVMFMNHHDVVEAEGTWKHPPFAGQIADGKLWGRGALDTKGGLFCMLQAAERKQDI